MDHGDLPNQVLKRVKASTLSMPKTSGRAVVTRGGLIVTAAHCLASINQNTWAGGAVLGDHHFEELIAEDGRKFWAQVKVAEAVNDIAVLGEPTAPDAGPYAEIVGSISGLTLYSQFGRDRMLPVWLRQKSGAPICAEVNFEFYDGCGQAMARSTKVADPGSSGGPIVDRRGRLLGIVSNSIEGVLHSECHWPVYLAAEILPRWVVRLMRGQTRQPPLLQ